jgi:hypothetical protein
MHSIPVSNAKEVFESCMRQAEYFSSRFNDRRKYEWQTTVALWTLLAAGIKFAPGNIPAWIPMPLVVAYAMLWLRGVWLANDKDKQMAHYYRCTAERLLLQMEPTLKKPAKLQILENEAWAGKIKSSLLQNRYFRFWFGFLLDWSMLFQLSSAIVLVVLFYEIRR